MWEIKEKGFNREKIIHYGNQFLTGHLRLGIRGTLDEYRKNELVAINLPLIYDQVGDGWRESINSFNPFFTRIKVNHKEVNLLSLLPINHEQTLNLKNGVMSRNTVFLVDDINITIYSERFVSYVDQRAVLGFFQVSSSKDALIEIMTGIDTDIWDIHGPHIEDVNMSFQKGLLASGISHEKKHLITCMKRIVPLFEYQSSKDEIRDQIILKTIVLEGKKDQTYRFEQYATFGVDEQVDILSKRLQSIVEMGYKQKLLDHQLIWDHLWFDADVEIIGDEQAQLALRYSIYHLIILSPNIYEKASIPARGISGQTYKGAVFWDTEIFMLPFYLNTNYKSARNIIEYRINALEKAKEKAAFYGYKGAFYAWESQEEGLEACTDYNVTDVFTNRLVRTYFRDKQIHISADIVYAIQTYINHTNDVDILKEGALEVICEVARFFLDYGHFSVLKDRFEIWDVLGPDEYHERVHNNAFTNQMIHFVFETVNKYKIQYASQKDSFFIKLIKKLHFENELDLISKYMNKFYLKDINSSNLIEQFDGYFKLNDIEKEELFKLKQHKHEYLGGHGLAGDTQIIKQADVIAMLYLFKDRYHKDILKSNFEYYEPRTEHGSSLSASMYALIACEIDQTDYAYPLFMKSASVDLTGESKQYAGGIYIGGTHPAASGGAYMTAIFGFSGLSFHNVIEIKQRLPKSFKSMKYRIKYKTQQFEIYVTQEDYHIKEIQK